MSKNALAALQQAVEVLGGQEALARRLTQIMGEPVSQGRIWNWLNRDRRVPGEAVLPIEQATREKGRQVSRHRLRPDLYPPEEYARAL